MKEFFSCLSRRKKSLIIIEQFFTQQTFFLSRARGVKKSLTNVRQKIIETNSQFMVKNIFFYQNLVRRKKNIYFIVASGRELNWVLNEFVVHRKILCCFCMKVTPRIFEGILKINQGHNFLPWKISQ